MLFYDVNNNVVVVDLASVQLLFVNVITDDISHIVDDVSVIIKFDTETFKTKLWHKSCEHTYIDAIDYANAIVENYHDYLLSRERGDLFAAATINNKRFIKHATE